MFNGFMIIAAIGILLIAAGLIQLWRRGAIDKAKATEVVQGDLFEVSKVASSLAAGAMNALQKLKKD